MKKIIALIVAVLFVFAVASVSIAAEEKKAAPAPAEKKAEKKAAEKVMQVTGEVAAVDAAAKTITVKNKKGDVVIAVDDKTLADVKAGDKVTAKYTSADGKNTAKAVKKAAAAKKAEPVKKEEPKKAEPAKKAAPAKKAPAAGY